MRLTTQQLSDYERDGLLVLPDLFSQAEVELMLDRLEPLLADRVPANFRERDSDVVRTAMSLHLRDEVFARLVRDPRLVTPVQQILGTDELYVQQVKINVKAAFTGEQWQWHYDFATHHREDGVPEPLAINVHIFLDEVNEFNGPLFFIPGSHRNGPVPTSLDTVTTSYPLWTVPPEVVGPLVADGGLVSPKGSPGTVLIFGDTMVHGSSANMSPWPRRIFSLILNPMSNRQTTMGRSEAQHHTDFTAVSPVEGTFAHHLQ